jgi:hypothetical protein
MENNETMMHSIKELKYLYDQGVNISQFLRERYGQENIPEIIELVYDLQTGSYVEAMKNVHIKSVYENRAKELFQIISHFAPPPPHTHNFRGWYR